MLLNLLQPNSQQKILEVGCGTGHFTFKVAQSGCQIVSIGQASNMLKQAEDQLPHDDQGRVL
ncbi:MAG: class I SAM-dependent methyltransferase [Lactobacillaceae bacterium]